MTKALQAASRLPDREQDEFAAILEELVVEARGEAAFARSHDTVERLACEARRASGRPERAP